MQPDILLLMPDQMRGDALSVLEHPVVRTPNLDALAEGGALFRRAYSTVASCIPARYALLTGLFPQTSGVVGFRAKPIATPTLPGVLADAGYASVLVGRNMHQVPESGACGYEDRILGSTYINDDAYDTFLRERAPECGGIRAVIDRIGVDCNGWEAAAWPLDDALHPTAWVVDESRGVVAETEVDRPLFLTASFYAPHPPLFPPRRIMDAVAQRTLPNAARGNWVTWDDVPEAQPLSAMHEVRLEGDVLRKAQAGYWGLIEHLDECIGPLVADFVARSERAGRPWVIVVTSDHGEMLGDHGYFRKCEPFEGSANIPMLIAGSPELGLKAGTLNHDPVCLEDVMPTLLELANAPCPQVDGVSLGPALRGEDVRTRDWLHFEHAPCYSAQQAYHALCDGHTKYIWRPEHGGEHLFDLDADPLEERDLTRESASAQGLAEWRALLVDRLAGRPEGFSDGKQLIAGRPYEPLF